jgi:signal transduction histidine kinase
MTDLLQSLVEFSRTRESMRYSYIDLTTAIDESIKSIRMHSEAGVVRFNAQYRDRVKAWFDAAKLRRVFFNLLFNACQANATVIDIQVITIGHTAEIEIRDNGDGVPDSVREKLFQPFTTSKQNGTGVGLAIVQKCCRDHGGEVLLETSRPGQTIFKIRLPLAGSEHHSSIKDMKSKPVNTV